MYGVYILFLLVLAARGAPYFYSPNCSKICEFLIFNHLSTTNDLGCDCSSESSNVELESYYLSHQPAAKRHIKKYKIFSNLPNMKQIDPTLKRVLSREKSVDAPTSVDVEIRGPINHKKISNMKLFPQIIKTFTENLITDCLDLHILVNSRKKDNGTELAKKIDNLKNKAFANLSDMDLTIEISKKCQPTAGLSEGVQEEMSRENSLETLEDTFGRLNERRNKIPKFRTHFLGTGNVVMASPGKYGLSNSKLASSSDLDAVSESVNISNQQQEKTISNKNCNYNEKKSNEEAFQRSFVAKEDRRKDSVNDKTYNQDTIQLFTPTIRYNSIPSIESKDSTGHDLNPAINMDDIDYVSKEQMSQRITNNKLNILPSLPEPSSFTDRGKAKGSNDNIILSNSSTNMAAINVSDYNNNTKCKKLQETTMDTNNIAREQTTPTKSKDNLIPESTFDNVKSITNVLEPNYEAGTSSNIYPYLIEATFSKNNKTNNQTVRLGTSSNKLDIQFDNPLSNSSLDLAENMTENEKFNPTAHANVSAPPVHTDNATLSNQRETKNMTGTLDHTPIISPSYTTTISGRIGQRSENRMEPVLPNHLISDTTTAADPSLNENMDTQIAASPFNVNILTDIKNPKIKERYDTEKNNDVTNGLIVSAESADSEVKTKMHKLSVPELTGRLYYKHGLDYSPVYFIQNSNGLLDLVIDGFSLCDTSEKIVQT